MSQELLFALLLAAIILLVFFVPRRQNNTPLEALGILFEGHQDEMELDYEQVRKMPGAELSVRMYCPMMSVMYNRNSDMEIIDVKIPRERGVIITFRNEMIATVERPGGALIGAQNVPSAQQRSIHQLARLVRQKAQVE